MNVWPKSDPPHWIWREYDFCSSATGPLYLISTFVTLTTFASYIGKCQNDPRLGPNVQDPLFFLSLKPASYWPNCTQQNDFLTDQEQTAKQQQVSLTLYAQYCTSICSIYQRKGIYHWVNIC